MTSDDPVLMIKDLRVSIGERTICRIDDLELHRGRCVAIVGESGSGKSTTLLAALGLVATMGATAEGSIKVHGFEVVGASEETMRKVRGARLAAVPQHAADSFNPTMKLADLMRRALAIHGVKKRDATKKIESAVASVMLREELLDRYPHQISGGQAQRFAIALALALDAELVLADEPTSALDVTVQAEMVALLRRLRAERNLTLLLVSHDLAVVSTLADSVFVMKDGEVVECGPTREVLGTPKTQYTRELLAAVPVLDLEESK
jgi:peptide/nickel transport system ATP-binding protein